MSKTRAEEPLNAKMLRLAFVTLVSLVLCCGAVLCVGIEKAHADIPDFIEFTDVDGNPLTGEMDLETIQKGILKRSTMGSGSYSVFSPSGDEMIYEIIRTAEDTRKTHLLLNTLQPNTQYRLVFTIGIEAGAPSYEFYFTTGPRKSSDQNPGPDQDPIMLPGSGEGEGSGADSTNDVAEGSSSTNSTVQYAVDQISDTAVDLTTTLAESSSVAGTTTGAALAGGGSLFKVSASAAGPTVENEVTAQSAFDILINGVPLLWVILWVVVIGSLPFGLSKRFLGYRYRLKAITRFRQ